jgi:hypothetical protein
VKLQFHNGHRAKLESLLELLDVGEVSHHISQSHKEDLQSLVDVDIFLLFLQLPLPEFLLVFDAFWRQLELASFLEVLDIDIFLFALADLLDALPAVDEVVGKQDCVLEVDLVEFLVLLIRLSFGGDFGKTGADVAQDDGNVLHLFKGVFVPH